MEKDRICYASPFSSETFYKCAEHNVAYPKGAKCPKCEYETDENVLELSLKALTEEFDEFIGACTDENGQPQQPNTSALMKAKACLPVGYKNAFKKKVRK